MDRQEIPQIMLTSSGYDSATVMSAKLKETVDGLPTLNMEIAITVDTALYVKEENIIGFRDDLLYGWRFFVIKEIVVSDDLHKRTMSVYCEDYALELIDNVCRIELKGDEYSVLSKMTQVLSGTRWAINPDAPDDPPHIKFPQETKNKSVLEVLQMIASEYGLHLKFEIYYYDGAIQQRYVTMKAEIGDDRGMVFDYNHNIASVERVIDSTDVKTAIIPVGGVPANSPKDTPPITITGVTWTTPTNPANKPNGQDYLVDDTATNLWGFSNPAGTKYPRYVYYQNTNITDPADLIQDAWNQLQLINAPMINYKMKVIDLFALSGYDYTNDMDLLVRLGDIVTVVDRSFLFDYVVTTHIISREVDLLNVGDTVLELGNFVKSIVSATSNFAGLVSSSGSVMKMGSGLAQLVNDVAVLNADVITANTAIIGTARIEDASITTAKIDDLAVDNAKIADASITNAKIVALAVGTAHIQDASINNAKIADAQITTAKIADLAVDTAKIVDASITNAKIDRVSADKLVVTSADIADATITTAKIATGAITTALIGTGAIETAQIADGSITDAKIVGLTASKITAGTIDAGVINVNNLNANNITAGTINGQRIADGAVDGTKIATNAVTNDKIFASTITGDKLVVDAITAREIASATITANEIASNTITASQIASGTITANEIMAGTITATEIASGAITADKLTAGIIQTVGTHVVAPCPSGLVNGGYLTGTTHSLLLTVIEVIHLGKCKVYADVVGSMDVNLYNNGSGALVATKNFSLVVGENILNLDWVLDPSVAGTYRLNGVTTTSKLWRNNVGVAFPYDGGSFQVSYYSSPTYYYFFYDMEISGVGVKGRIVDGTTISGNSITTGTISADLISGGTINGVTINASTNLGIIGASDSPSNPRLTWKCSTSIGSSTIVATPANPGISGSEYDTLFWNVNSSNNVAYRGSVYFSGTYDEADFIVHGTIQTGDGAGYANAPFGVDNSGNLKCASLVVNSGDSVINGVGVGRSNEIWCNSGTTLYLSYRGTSGGTTNFVTTKIMNGKGVSMASFSGSANDAIYDAAIKLQVGGNDGYAIRNLNVSGRGPAIAHAQVYCTNGATVYYDHPDVAGAYEAVACGRDTAVACKATAGATTTATYFAGTQSGYINIALFAFV